MKWKCDLQHCRRTQHSLARPKCPSGKLITKRSGVSWNNKTMKCLVGNGMYFQAVFPSGKRGTYNPGTMGSADSASFNETEKSLPCSGGDDIGRLGSGWPEFVETSDISVAGMAEDCNGPGASRRRPCRTRKFSVQSVLAPFACCTFLKLVLILQNSRPIA